MALHIKEENGTFKLFGNMNADHAHDVRFFMRTKLRFASELKISLENLDSMDLSGAMLFNDLKKEALEFQKTVSVRFGSNKKITGPLLMIQDNVLLKRAA